MMNIPIKLLSSNAKVPVRADSGAAGYDLYAAHGAYLMPGARALIQTDISVAIPLGWYGRIAPRSGLAVKAGVDVLGGVVDSSYRGNVGVILVNHGYEGFEVRTGDRIAQLIIERCAAPEWQVVEDLDETERAAGGFGSTDGISIPDRMIPTVAYMREFDPTYVSPYIGPRALNGDEIARGGNGRGTTLANTPFNPLDHEQTK